MEIGNNSGIGDSARLGAVKIGDNVMMAPDVTILSRNHVFDDKLIPMSKQGVTEENPVIISDDV